MSRSQRDKGARAERELVKLLRDAGYDAKRVPLSGACEGFKGDVLLNMTNDQVCICRSCPRHGDSPDEYVIETKVRANGFKQLYSWLDGSDLLMVRADRKEWLVIQRFSEWVKRG